MLKDDRSQDLFGFTPRESTASPMVFLIEVSVVSLSVDLPCLVSVGEYHFLTIVVCQRIGLGCVHARACGRWRQGGLWPVVL
jgi:hypothetical protein